MSEENKKSASAQREEKILEFWKDNNIFEKSMSQTEGKKEFVFFEGPPTANGKPGIHHLIARAFKDAIPRYKTMQGFHVRRKGGWDTHGLPVELQVEKSLGLNSKKAIEEYGIAKFNEQCKESVWQYLSVWEKFTDRIGYWVDQKKPYVTYHNDYIESVWNVMKKVDDKKLLYKDYRIVPWCSRCGTALSSHELAQGYQDDKDLSVTAKFKVVGEDNTYILAWTTTPWTLPGNVALAVGNDIDYVKVKKENDILILAQSRISVLGEELEIVGKVKGSELVGLEYEPLYPYLKDNIADSQKENLKKAFKVYPADFVTTEDGTGVVHTAVMYGADDFELGTKLGLPKQHMVNLDGTFVSYTDFLSGRFVKDEEVAIDIIKDLAHRGLLFKKEKYEHSYPHCWRCKTPLIYYARDSWYIRVSDSSVKEKMIEENKKINWEPSYIRDGRFGEWLKDIKDWAISRERYWGTPLPIWISESGKIEVIGSLDDLKSKTKKSGNKYFVARHGQAESNVAKILNGDINKVNPLTETGRNMSFLSGKELNENFDMIFCSPFQRTKETAQAMAEASGFDVSKIITDERLREVFFGSFEGMSIEKYHEFYKKAEDYFTTAFDGGESQKDIYKRVGDFIYELEQKYSDKKILIVTHGDPSMALSLICDGFSRQNILEKEKEFKYFSNSEIRKLDFVPLPHNENYELDLHKPYIDDVELVSDNGEKLTRVKEVVDVWFDSGAMPFAQDHYPFENKELVDDGGYPADFICEAIDQTRGWFYTLHAVGALMDRGLAYKNVICLGHILDAQGKKMSKSLGNIVDPWEMIEKYGVDTLRLWMYSVNQPGESKNFDEKTVSELHNKVFNLLYNVLAFYELYRDTQLESLEYKKSENILDQWIVARLNQTIEISTKYLNEYKLLEPVRTMREFIEDLSTWYVRRSRDRIKDGDVEAKQTLYFVLKTFAKIIAPFAPFSAEDIWLKLKNEKDESSVHLEKWPESNVADEKLIEEMKKVREVITLGLQLRQKQGVPVRQPLGKVSIVSFENLEKYTDIIKDELNIENVSVLIQNNENGVIESMEGKVILDFVITDDLKKKGNYRELVRSVQDARKKAGLTPSDIISLSLSDEAKGIISGFEDDMKKTVLAKEINFGETAGEKIKIGDLEIVIVIKK